MRNPAVPPEPLTLSQVLALAMRVYRDNGRLMLLMGAVTIVPLGILQIAAGIFARGTGGARQAAIEALLLLVPQVLLLPVSGALVATATLEALAGRAPSADRAFGLVGLRFWALGGAVVITFAGVASGLIAFMLPGIWLLVVWLFAAQVTVVEGLSPRAALRRSKALVDGGWWSVFGRLVVIQVIAAAAMQTLLLPGRGVFSGTAGNARIVGLGTWQTVATAIVEPWVLVAIALLYADRTLRRDGTFPRIAYASGSDAT